jgi:hypothetical protein
MAEPNIHTAASKLGSDRHAIEAKLRQHRRKRPGIAVLRASEVNKILTGRYGRQFPDDDAGRDDLFIWLLARSHRGDGEPELRPFIRTKTPWMGESETAALLDRIYAAPTKLRADTWGRWLGLSDAVRTRLGITTIGAMDVPREQRQARRHARKVARRRELRRERGVRSRAEYENSLLAKRRPWEAFGIKRRAWERRGKPLPPADDASLTPSNLTYYRWGSHLRREGLGDRPVQVRGGQEPAKGCSLRSHTRSTEGASFKKKELAREEETADIPCPSLAWAAAAPQLPMVSP